MHLNDIQKVHVYSSLPERERGVYQRRAEKRLRDKHPAMPISFSWFSDENDVSTLRVATRWGLSDGFAVEVEYALPERQYVAPEAYSFWVNYFEDMLHPDRLSVQVGYKVISLMDFKKTEREK